MTDRAESLALRFITLTEENGLPTSTPKFQCFQPIWPILDNQKPYCVLATPVIERASMLSWYDDPNFSYQSGLCEFKSSSYWIHLQMNGPPSSYI